MSSLSTDVLGSIKERVAKANGVTAKRYPEISGARQPIHTVYGGAQLFASDLAQKLGSVALRNLDTYGGTPDEFAQAVGLRATGETAALIMERVRAKLEREAVEDFRIDFEDGYGNRPDEEEDGHARAAAEQTALAMEKGTIPPFIGIRIKTFSDELLPRSLRTLDLYITTLVEKTGGKLPDNFVVTLPKITSTAHVEALVTAFEAIEKNTSLEEGALKMEFMVETTQSVLGPDGYCPLVGWAEASQGRLVAAHYGTYDYTASCGITAAYQHMRHGACDYARYAMQVAFASTKVFLSDGATNIMPVPVHRAAKDGPALTEGQIADNLESVRDAWKLHVTDIRHSLEHGYYQGWDLHPAQLVTRYAAVYDFFHDGLPAATERLENFLGKAAQATLVGDVFDDAATGQGLLNFFLRGISCGAFPEEAALKTGITIDELRSRSFVYILNNRK